MHPVTHPLTSLVCASRLPNWLEKDQLEELVKEEHDNRDENKLTKVDFHYQELAALLFRHSPDSFAGQEVAGQEGEYNPRVVVKDLEELREVRLLKFMLFAQTEKKFELQFHAIHATLHPVNHSRIDPHRQSCTLHFER